MRATLLMKRFGAVLTAGLVILFAPTTQAAKPAAAQLGPIWITANPTSGGTLSYQVNLNVTSPGTLTVQATVRSATKGKKWKATFPVFNSEQSVGLPTVDASLAGISLPIPTNFVGNASLRFRVRFNKRVIGKPALLFLVSAPSPTPAAPQTAWHDVGFGTNVLLNAEAVNTNGLTGPLTYAWSILDTDVRTNATFSSASAETPLFATLPITQFTNTLEITSGSTTNVLEPVDLDKEFDLATYPFFIGLNPEQIAKSTYHLQVVVTDAAAVARTGAVVVVSSSVSPAQPSIPVGERQYFTAEPNGTNVSTFAWKLVAKPVGSTALLESGNTRTPALRPDVEGDYALQLIVRGGGETNTSFVTVHGATYVGVSACASCHGPSQPLGLKDIHTPWSQTAHGTIFQRAINGVASNPPPLGSQTVGYNESPAATNGNFHAIAQQLGWTYPTSLNGGNYLTVPGALREVANVSCESCHGPGSQHPGEESASLDVAICATCHQDGNQFNQAKQWRLGPHGADDGFLVSSEEEASVPSCTKCHSPTSFVDHLKGKPLTRLEAGRLTCQGCHDPHNLAGYPAAAKQVRIYDTTTLDDAQNPTNPPVLTGQGTSALCMYCHNGRRSPPPTFAASTGVPHGGSTATDVLLGIRASTNVQVIVSGVTNTIATVTLVNSAHAGTAKCVDCHMHKGSDTVGDHTFSMTDRLTEAGNVAACAACHDGVDPVTSLDHISVVRSGFPGAGDYNGNGVVEGVQTEVAGIQQQLRDKMLATGMVGFGRSARYSTDPLLRAVQRNAAWNDYLVYRDLSHGIHNTAFAVRLLQWSYTVLSTNTGGNAYSVDFPNADLR